MQSPPAYDPGHGAFWWNQVAFTTSAGRISVHKVKDDKLLSRGKGTGLAIMLVCKHLCVSVDRCTSLTFLGTHTQGCTQRDMQEDTTASQLLLHIKFPVNACLGAGQIVRTPGLAPVIAIIVASPLPSCTSVQQRSVHLKMMFALAGLDLR